MLLTTHVTVSGAQKRRQRETTLGMGWGGVVEISLGNGTSDANHWPRFPIKPRIKPRKLGVSFLHSGSLHPIPKQPEVDLKSYHCPASMLGWLPTLPGAKPNLAAKSSSCSLFLPSSMSLLSFPPHPPPAFLLFPECPKLAPTSGPSHMLFPIIFYFLLQVLIQRLLLPFLSLCFLFHHPGLFSL